MRNILTDIQKKFINENYLKLSGNDMGSQFGCCGDVVRRYMKKVGLIVPKETRYSLQAAKRTGITTATKEEDKFIKENYLTMAIKPLGDKIGRGYNFVMSRLAAMGLTLPLEIIERNRQSAQIKKGNVPMNKGRKQSEYMTEEAIAKTAGTRFKKGQVPVNAKPYDGFITIRHNHEDRGDKPYVWIRISLGVWKELHRYNWEIANGPIPAGHCLWCKNGDTLECYPDNWELITRKENRMRNSSSVLLKDKYIANCIAWRDEKLKQIILQNPGLIELKRQQIILNRKINENTPV